MLTSGDVVDLDLGSPKGREAGLRRSVVVVTAAKRDFDEMNDAYGEFFGDHRPARTTCGVELVDVLVEMEAIAVRGSASD